MSDEPNPHNSTESRWQPIAVVSMRADEPKKRNWALFFAAQSVLWCSVGIGGVWTAYSNLQTYAELADRPLERTYIVPLTLCGATFLTAGGVAFGCALGSWITNSRAKREKP
jgi:hypothetical protein